MGASKSRGEKPLTPLSEGKPTKSVHAAVCDENALNDGEMQEFEVHGKNVLLVRHQGEYHAIGAKCTHYGATLANGALCNGRVRCPWHGACFDVRTGDIEDYPGLDSLPKFNVEISNGKVNISTDERLLQTKKRVKEMVCESLDNEEHYVLIGGGPASVVCAETLRQEGFTGKITLATKENCLPYDRPKLSKAPDSVAESIALRNGDFYAIYDIQVLKNKEATAVDTMLKNVTFQDGEVLHYDKLLIATGGSPRKLEIPGGDLKNVCYLRTPSDGQYLASQAKGNKVAIVGTSFIGMEIAAALVGKAASVTVIGRSEVPFQATMGEIVGRALMKLHESKGVKIIGNNTLTEFVGKDGKLSQVVLQDGTRVDVDLCIVGAGVSPTTKFLNGAGIEMNGQGCIVVDKGMKTNKSDVYAAGDIVEFPLWMTGESVNIGHWQMAHAHGRIAAQSMLGQHSEIQSVPFFWTQQFGKSLRFTGYNHGYDDVVVHGDTDSLKFIVYYTKGEKVVAVAALGRDPICSQAAEMFFAGKVITKEEVKDSADGWVSRLKS